jgi:hypothetical protein
VRGDVVMSCGDIRKCRLESWKEMTEVDTKLEKRISGETGAT